MLVIRCRLRDVATLFLLATSQILVAQTVAAATIKAEADTDWGWDDNQSGQAQAAHSGGGFWSLGINMVEIQAKLQDPIQIMGNYEAGQTGATIPLFLQQGPSIARASSSITVGDRTDRGWFPWSMRWTSEAETAFFGGDEAVALAQGMDPQFVESSGVVDHSLSLGSGSTIFASGGQAEATSTFNIDSSLGPVARIFLRATRDGLEADVELGASGFSFFDPLTLLPITSLQIENLLLSSQLYSPDGLSEPLILFRFSSTSALPAGATLGASGRNTARVATEPATLLLVGAGLGFLGYRRRSYT